MAANPHASYSAVPAARDDANATPQDVWPTEVAGTGRRKLAVCAGLLAGWLGVVGLVRSNVDGAASGASVGKALAGTAQGQPPRTIHFPRKQELQILPIPIPRAQILFQEKLLTQVYFRKL